MATIALLAVLAAIIGFFYKLYVNIVTTKNAVMEALSGIDVQLKKRYDLIPNILTIAKKFMEHETELFEKIAALRSRAMAAPSGSKEKFEAEAQLDTQMRTLAINVENYPQLKSDAPMADAMQTYKAVEEEIAVARKFYNSTLTKLKNIIQIFPGSLLASFAGEAKDFSWFEADAASREPVDASKFL